MLTITPTAVMDINPGDQLEVFAVIDGKSVPAAGGKLRDAGQAGHLVITAPANRARKRVTGRPTNQHRLPA